MISLAPLPWTWDGIPSSDRHVCLAWVWRQVAKELIMAGADPTIKNKAKPVFDPNQVAEIAQIGGKRSLPTLHVFIYGVARNRLTHAAKRLNLPLEIVDEVDQAQALVTLKNYYRRRPKLIVDSERRGLPIYVLRANTVTQMENFLIDVFQLERHDSDPLSEGLRDAEEGIRQVLSGSRQVSLDPQPPYIRRKQHEMARQANVVSHSYGKEPQRHVRIFRDELPSR